MLAEAEAAVQALNLVTQLRTMSIQLESDPKILIDNINGHDPSRAWTIYPILEEIHRLSASLEEVEWRWIPRWANRAAHAAATIRMRTVVPQGWVNQPASSMVQVLVSDGLPFPPN